MPYLVTRHVGIRSDLLCSFKTEWGTVCGGHRPLIFPTEQAARAAARKARRCCMGWNRKKQRKARARMNFEAIPAYR